MWDTWVRNTPVAFGEYDGKIEDLVAYKQISGHLIFDVKLSENFRRKARFVADGHLVEAETRLTSYIKVLFKSITVLLISSRNYYYC